MEHVGVTIGRFHEEQGWELVIRNYIWKVILQESLRWRKAKNIIKHHTYTVHILQYSLKVLLGFIVRQVSTSKEFGSWYVGAMRKLKGIYLLICFMSFHTFPPNLWPPKKLFAKTAFRNQYTPFLMAHNKHILTMVSTLIWRFSSQDTTLYVFFTKADSVTALPLFLGGREGSSLNGWTMNLQSEKEKSKEFASF